MPAALRKGEGTAHFIELRDFRRELKLRTQKIQWDQSHRWQYICQSSMRQKRVCLGCLACLGYVQATSPSNPAHKQKQRMAIKLCNSPAAKNIPCWRGNLFVQTSGCMLGPTVRAVIIPTRQNPISMSMSHDCDFLQLQDLSVYVPPFLSHYVDNSKQLLYCNVDIIPILIDSNQLLTCNCNFTDFLRWAEGGSSD